MKQTTVSNGESRGPGNWTNHKPHLVLHCRLGTHAGPWWWVELEDGRETSYWPTARRAIGNALIKLGLRPVLL